MSELKNEAYCDATLLLLLLESSAPPGQALIWPSTLVHIVHFRTLVYIKKKKLNKIFSAPKWNGCSEMAKCWRRHLSGASTSCRFDAHYLSTEADCVLAKTCLSLTVSSSLLCSFGPEGSGRPAAVQPWTWLTVISHPLCVTCMLWAFSALRVHTASLHAGGPHTSTSPLTAVFCSHLQRRSCRACGVCWLDSFNKAAFRRMCHERTSRNIQVSFDHCGQKSCWQTAALTVFQPTVTCLHTLQWGFQKLLCHINFLTLCRSGFCLGYPTSISH